MSSQFGAYEDEWRQRLRMLPDTVRQELTARQVAEHIPAEPVQVLDVGCGQGTQALRLAAAGHEVTGVDHSPDMLVDAARALAAHDPAVRERVRLVEAEADQVADRFGDGTFDVALCHGVLMYLDDPAPTLTALTRVLAPGGMLSLLVRNADSLAINPGMRGNWKAAHAAFEAARYRTRVGAEARADRRLDLSRQLAGLGLTVSRWYGVLTFCEVAAMEATVPAAHELAEIVACEEQAGRTDPYRQIAAMLHLIAHRPG